MKKNCTSCGTETNGTTLCKKCYYKTHYKKTYRITCKDCGCEFDSGQPKRLLCDTCRTKPCETCGKRFVIKMNYFEHFFCSEACYRVYAAAPIRKCEWCGGDFKQRGGNPKTKYCSPQCRYEAAHVPDSQKHAGYKYKQWVTAVYERDGFSCTKCGATGAIHAHHVRQWKTHPELRYDVDNGVTLCQDCHQVEHGMKIPRASKRFQPICEQCGKKTKGHSRYCKSCAVKIAKASKRLYPETHQTSVAK